MIEDEHKTDFTASVGVNLTHDLSIGSAMAASALPDEGGNGGTGFGDLNCPPRLAAFSVYYDDTTKSLKMVDPQIVVCGKEVKCEALAEVEDGIYYCNVRRNTSSNEYEAKVEPVMAIDSAESKAVCSVKLFKLDGEDFTQYHAGVIALYDIGAKLTLQNKEESGSIALDASGDSPKLVIEKDGKSISLDLSQIPDNCKGGVYGIKTITVPRNDGTEDTDVYHVVGCSDIDLTGLGKGATTLSTGDTNKLLTITGSPEKGYKLSVPDPKISVEEGDGISIADNTISNSGVLSVAAGEGDGINGKVVLDAPTESGLTLVANDKTITIDVNGRANGEGLALHDVKIGDNDEAVARVFGTDDITIGTGVTSANGATGDVNVIGGKGIEVSTDGQTIKVTWNKDKEEEDEDPNDDDGDEPSNPCDHDSEGGGEGGVEAGGGIGGGGGGTGDDEGGVPAGGGESHTGDDNCNCG